MKPIKPVQWGVLSSAKIGLEKVIPAMQQSPFCHIAAIASRSLAQAQKAADQLAIDRAYGSYEELLADPGIEAIYNPLPNHLHLPWTLAAARAGKHVLCEKPFTLNASQAAQLREVAGQVYLMEAFMVRFHPQWLRAREIVRSGALGQLHTLQVFFSFFNRQPENIRNRLDVGGGALYDIGCYCVTAGRFLFEAEPLRVLALIERDPDFGTDRTASALVDFGQGRRLDFTVSTQSTPYQRLHAVGVRQRLEIEIPFNAPPDQSTRIFIDNGQQLGAAPATTETFAPCNQYTLQGEAFSRAVRGEIALPYGVDDALCNMQVLDALYRSGQSQAWEAVHAV